MALIVVCNFDDDNEALDFAEAHEAKVIAIHKRPTQFCQGCSGRKTDIGFTRGTKFGWWVCAKCRKPKWKYWQTVLSRDSKPPFSGPYGFNIFTKYFDSDTEEKAE